MYKSNTQCYVKDISHAMQTWGFWMTQISSGFNEYGFIHVNFDVTDVYTQYRTISKMVNKIYVTNTVRIFFF